MTTQADKGISTIAYNFLNLPYHVVQNGVTTEYLYRADGTKLKKSYGTGKVTDYLDGFQYELENGEAKLQFVPTSEGYYDFVKNLYIYNYVDHLGNVRLSYADNNKNGTIEASTEIIEENNYYPFGLKHSGYNNIRGANQSYQYKYNGKELQEFGMYDYGARFYMPDIDRWFSPDPLSEEFDDLSPYSYAENNPILFIDPDGMASEAINNSDKNGDPPVKTVNIQEVVLQGAPKREPFTGFLGNLNYFWNGGNFDGFHYDREGIATGRSPIMLQADIGRSSGVNTVYKGVKGGLPYIGKAFNIVKRYSKSQRTLMKIKPVLNNIKDPKLLRAVEQKVIEYMRSKGPVANVRNAFNPKNKNYQEYSEQAVKWLNENYPNWKKLF